VRDQVGDEVLRAALVDVQLDVRVPGVEVPQDDRHQRGAQARRRAEPDPPAAQPDHFLHGVAGGVGVGDHPAGQRQQRLAGGGQHDGAAGAVEQRGAQRRLQGVNLLTQRRLADPERLRRG